MRWVVLRLPTCAFYQVKVSQPGYPCPHHPRRYQHLSGSRHPRPRLLPRPLPSLDPSTSGLHNLNDILALVFIYSLVAVFALLLLASFAYLILRCLEPPSPT